MEKNRENKFFIFSATILLAISVFLHTWQIGEVPNGFFYDESSIGYNAYSILKTGADEYGYKLPLFFRGFENYHDPVMVYCLVPLIKFFGLNKTIVRLPSAIFHIAASVGFAFLVWEYVKNKWISLIFGFLFSILPWSFPLSRINMAGYTPMLMGIGFGWLLLIKSIKNESIKLAVISGICWAFAMYSHNCGRPMSATMLICFIIAFNKTLIKRWKIPFFLFISLFIMLIPMLLAFLSNPACLTSRFMQISLYHQSSGIQNFISGIFIRYVEYFSPQFLFLTGDEILRHNTGVGELYFSFLPFLISGLFVVWQKRKNPFVLFLFYCIITFPLAAILTNSHMHATRSVNGAIPLCLLASAGVKMLIEKTTRSKILKIFLFAFCFLPIFEAASYLIDYFGEYRERSRMAFNASIVETIEQTFHERKTGETIYISVSFFPNNVNQHFKPYWYAHLLFFGKIDPVVYQQKGILSEIASLYNPKNMPSSGLLLRINSIIIYDQKSNPYIIFGYEDLPKNAVLLYSSPFYKGSYRHHELYRF